MDDAAPVVAAGRRVHGALLSAAGTDVAATRAVGEGHGQRSFAVLGDAGFVE